MKRKNFTYGFFTGLLLAFGIYDSYSVPPPSNELSGKRIGEYWGQVGGYIYKAMHGSR